jgi:hypothetical protein
MPRNPDSPIAGGSNTDPEFRRLRGQYGAQRRESLDRYVQKIVDHAPELTGEQKDKLAALLRSV